MEDFQCDEANLFHCDENKLSQAIHHLLDEPFLLIVKHISDCNADVDDDCADDKSGSKAPFVLTTKALCWFIDSGRPPGTTTSQSRTIFVTLTSILNLTFNFIYHFFII